MAWERAANRVPRAPPAVVALAVAGPQRLAGARRVPAAAWERAANPAPKAPMAVVLAEGAASVPGAVLGGLPD